jgi:hypothetical protein
VTDDKSSSTHHILLTRFNVRLGNAAQHRGLDLQWLDPRIAMFSEWSLPSVRAQGQKPSGWLIFVDADTDPARLAQIRALTANIASVIPVDGPLGDEQVGEYVGRFVPAECTRVITTRLDNDDALAPYYVERIAEAARGWEGFINPFNGLTYAGNGTVLRCWDFSSPFLSMVEQHNVGRRPMTVFSVRHDRADMIARVRQLGGSPMWVQCIHGNNIANQVRGVPYSRSRARRLFGMSFGESAARLSFREYALGAAREAYKTPLWLTKRLTRIR